MKHFALLILFCLSLLQSNCFSQKVHGRTQAKLLTRFPFRLLTGGVIILKAKIDEHADSLNFILDTGSGGISLDSSTIANLGIVTTNSDRTIKGIGGVKRVNFAMDHQLKLPGLTISKLDFHVNDYDLLTSAYGVKIDGIIGYSVLRRYIIAIDYDLSVISFYTPGLYRYAKGGYMLKPVFTSMPLQTVTVEDERTVTARFLFDTGAGLCLLFSDQFVTDSSFFQSRKKVFHSYGEGIGGKKAMQLTVIKQVKIGPYRFKKVPVFVFSDDYNITSYPLMKGLIGNDVLRRFNTVINYPDQCIHIKPNSRFRDDFDYAYTGLEIYFINGRVTVEDVIPGSPADEAGFKPGDILIGINKTITNDMQVYKHMLQEPGSKLKVIISREGDLFQLLLHVKDIR